LASKSTAGVVPGPISCTAFPEKGGELMEVYTLEVEVLEDKLAPIGISMGGE
jgi:hypothetical protein